MKPNQHFFSKIVQNAKVNPNDQDLNQKFTIDQTLGRDVEIVVDFIPDGSVSELDLFKSDGTLVTIATPQSGEKTVVLRTPKLEVRECTTVYLIQLHV